MDSGSRYALDVLAGKDNGRLVRLAARRHIDDWKRSKQAGSLINYQSERGLHVINFVERFCCVKGSAGAVPFRLMPWQKFIIQMLYSWRFWDADTERWVRRFRNGYLMAGKGCGKSPLVASLALYEVQASDNPSPSVYLCGTTFRQCQIVWDDIKYSLQHSPELRALVNYEAKKEGGLRLKGHPPVMEYEQRNASVEMHSLESETAGRRPTLIIADELADFNQKRVQALTELEMGFKSTPNPLLLAVTNTGHTIESPFGITYKQGRQALEGSIIQERIFYMFFETEMDDEPFADEQVWSKANPSLSCGLPSRDSIRAAVQKGDGDMAQRAETARLYFGRWGADVSGAIPAALFDANLRAMSDDELGDKPCVLSIDLSAHHDLTALACVWLLPEAEFYARVYTWAVKPVPNSVLQTGHSEIWRHKGYLRSAEAPSININLIADAIKDMADRFNVRGLTYDQWRVSHLFQILRDYSKLKLSNKYLHRIDKNTLFIIEHPQSNQKSKLPVKPNSADPEAVKRWNRRVKNHEKAPNLAMDDSISTLLNLLKEGRLGVEENPVLRWSLSGCTLVVNTRGAKTLKKGGVSQSDPAIALTMAVGFANDWRHIFEREMGGGVASIDRAMERFRGIGA